MDSLLKDGKCYLTVSGLNYTFDPEVRSTLQVNKVTTTPSSVSPSTPSGASTSSKQNAGGPAIDIDVDGESTTANVESTMVDSGNTEGNVDSTLESDDMSSIQSDVKTESARDASESTKGNSLTWLWIVLAVIIVVAGGGAAIYFFVIKKKNSNLTDTNQNK